MKHLSFAVALITLPIFAQAGIPTQTTLVCPIGGESFEITETLSCTNYPDRTMSFAPTSSCDFITRLPQCPANFLPMYKEFTEAEITLLQDYMLSESYDGNVDGSRFYLAYIVEKYLADDPAQPFWLLLSGLWYDAENTFDNQQFMDAFFQESVAELARVGINDLPYAQAVIAFAYARSGQMAMAQELLDLAKQAGISDGVLPLYIIRIEGCIADPENAQCAPTAPIEPR